ncbi:MAG: hypothetical protein KKB90_12190 [Actinobacteria bacterium]|nr:hypothetical protein [Actinomycetota bacterium]MCG2819053.1 hypothetical protein [Actinomycetes bacterium]MBU4219705.1 hypothetical protein [Actinomycetota bacterium]MBU4357686.1 hypothetical protein [Actinomycetota bacterium]MBU4391946.1 hypothetical protein [Actinomycetota bacterium]
MDRIYIDELMWDDENMSKVAQHQLTVSEVYEALVLDTNRTASWEDDREHGLRVLAMGTCESNSKVIIAPLDPVDEAEGIWRPRTAWRLK